MITEKLYKKFEVIADNRTNGNWTDYREALRKMNKYTLVKFMSYCKAWRGDVKVHNIITDIIVMYEK